MNVLMVCVPHESKLFHERMKDTAVETLMAQGHEVNVIGFHDEAMAGPPRRGFFPGLLSTDLDPRLYTAPIFSENPPLKPSAIHSLLGSMDPFDWADIVVFQFPLWWFLMPATLRQWRCRVATWYRNRVQSDRPTKKAMLALTTPTDALTPAGRERELEVFLRPVQEDVLHRAGFNVLPPFIAWGLSDLEEWQRDTYLREYRERIACLDHISPLFSNEGKGRARVAESLIGDPVPA
ncbi:NAD(P)H-dependent oxidoreductase [Sulfidibacter corallicola]|uniref:NAD(P)H-dependent oxidoreductase n=1 Tax=Sulfidibacter corallicola TaxID=2818388 RepID=A0A8A4TSF0_SULCO|nr:NAD(P)H-dependent oxidoreductase [Sulfidibacter corallicola]QTD52317.1 NAD(P)H-dependent oxidoreductase [Sulfidibacter corallicola]